MAIARLSVKVGKVGKAQPHSAYIARQGQYAGRLERGEKLEATGAGNMPAWAEHDPLIFWDAADTNERKNGSTYREHELALPRELSPDQRLDLLSDWIKHEIGDRYAYQFAIHAPKASDGEEQPHAHLMFSERRFDGIDRDPDRFFKRYNSKHPERGGAKKDNTGMKAKDRKEALVAQRQRWEEMCNAHLERAGQDARIDMRSYEDQGKAMQPERKMLPSEWSNPETRAKVIEFRQSKEEMRTANKELADVVPDFGAAIIRLQEKQQRRIEKQRLSPENIEKAYNGILKRAEQFVQDHYAKLEAVKDKACKVWSDHNSTKPAERSFASKVPLVGYVMLPHQEKKYQAKLKEWEEKEKELRSKRIDAGRALEQKFQSVEQPIPAAGRLFKLEYPKMAKERDRLQEVEKQRNREKLKQEREVKQQRSQSRGRGGFER